MKTKSPMKRYRDGLSSLEEEPVKFSQKIKDMLLSAWDDDCVCMVGTVGQDGPNISPKGSIVVYDDDHLAYWERAYRKAAENVAYDPRVVVIYSNMKASREGELQAPALRFYGTAEVHDSGPIKDKIFSMMLKREQEHVGADKGVGVLIKIERAQDIRGNPIAE
jgi:uncharacterized protein